MSINDVLLNGDQAFNTQTTKQQLRTMNFPPTPNPEPEMSPNGKRSSSTMHQGAFGEHLAWIIEHDSRLQHCTDPGSAKETVLINGQDLSLAEVVAVSCHRAQVRLTDDEKIRSSVNASIDFIKEHLDRGEVVYGINTGFGGSADARSSDFTSVQRGLIQHQNGAILLPSDTGRQPNEKTDNLTSLKSHALPRTVVRAAMLARCNSLMRGHSAVRLSVIDSIVALLNHDFIPVIPLRGSISASGDLMPLSYIAGALEGNHDIYLDCRTSGNKREILPASEALRRAGLAPTVMRPKEGLGLMNGTAVSVAAGTLALHETQYLILATQALTAMCTEALRGSADNFHPFISNVRPHSGQREVAENIWRQLKTSKLVVGKDSKWAGLYQDRYALRTASQWIGPQIEDLMLSTRQLDVELNSTTDNPLIDADEGIVHHGGNFQAVSVTSAMEKTRLALNMLGKLMFAQSSELINPMLNNILTPNLCFDEPGVSFTFKGVDINMAAYYAELAYLANPVSTHVQSAEMHNQAVNSMALVSARYTLDAVEIVSLMTAAFLYALCQALDLHVLFEEYLAEINRAGFDLFKELFGSTLDDSALQEAWETIRVTIRAQMIASKTKDLPVKAAEVADATLVPLTKALIQTCAEAKQDTFGLFGTWTKQFGEVVLSSVRAARISFASAEEGHGPSTSKYLGNGSRVLYKYVREDLAIPLHKGLVEHPTAETERDGVKVSQEEKQTIGSRISKIYAALRSGEMRGVLIKSLS
ncbi:phenylalanine ammonia-lyase [Hortaea werneckii]|uniref:Phenylalanine ammonia-lyase n=1 Tax=Hortaea werneckii TaxID=91943 RepID=A0A3M6YS87_HORWE|nr:phenylalanine ammonia-lyase [Hortaea werneckii]KAI6989278.1 phenylalanine ammonia-lyase [Hortaea werneckii]KAI7657418.1 phenylalanine ammonia-lyase [Hortaea werneckii]RMY05853.1 hypothetical protein D0867_09896 [Hortaea werneckii]